MAPPIRSKSLQALYDRVVAGDPEMAADIDRGYEDLKIGVALAELRTAAGLSTRALAKLVGTQPSVISRIEHAAYEGHSLSMLRRVAAALGRRVVVTFPPIEEAAEKPKRAARGKASREKISP
jgi:ribosome-binding protein aMBF1 (putative translation factor)